MTNLSRRSFASGVTFVLGAGVLGAACGRSGSSGSSDGSSGAGDNSGGNKKIVVSTFPFGVEAVKKAVIESFTKATGIEVEVETGSNAERLQKLDLNKRNPKVDLSMLTDFAGAQGQEKGLFAKFDQAKVANAAKLSKFAVDSMMGPAYTFQLNGMLYRTEALKPEEAADWEVFSNGRWAKKFALPDYSATSGQLTLAAVGTAYGSGPTDVDAGIAKMKSWSPNTLKFFATSSEVSSLLQRNEIVIAPSIQGFAAPLIKAREPIAFVAPAKARYMATNRLMITAGTKNWDAVHKFIDHYLSVEAQQAAAEQVGDNPVRTDVKVPELLTRVAGRAAVDPLAEGYKALDMGPLVKNNAQWSERYAREVAGK